MDDTSFQKYKGFCEIVVPSSIANQIEKDKIDAAERARRLKEAHDENQGNAPDEAADQNPAIKEVAASAKCRERAEKKQRTVGRLLKVFNEDHLQAARERAKKNSDAKHKMPDIDAALRNNGYRLVPKWNGKLLARLDKLEIDFPNFREAIETIKHEMLLASNTPPEHFRVSPILMNGPPGIGKTAFANKIAEILGVGFEQMSAAGMQTGAQIVGSAEHWSGSSPSQLFRALARGEHATFVLLVDEIDKLSTDDRFNVLPSMLALLEPESARKMKCESTGVDHDLSRLIIVATSNDLDWIYPALRSRFQTIEVKAPGRTQREMIARGEHAKMRKQLRRNIELDQAALDDLVNADCDVREILRAVRRGFSKAMVSGNGLSRPVVLNKPTRNNDGFGFLKGKT